MPLVWTPEEGVGVFDPLHLGLDVAMFAEDKPYAIYFTSISVD